MCQTQLIFFSWIAKKIGDFNESLWGNWTTEVYHFKIIIRSGLSGDDFSIHSAKLEVFWRHAIFCIRLSERLLPKIVQFHVYLVTKESHRFLMTHSRAKSSSSSEICWMEPWWPLSLFQKKNGARVEHWAKWPWSASRVGTESKKADLIGIQTALNLCSIDACLSVNVPISITHN